MYIYVKNGQIQEFLGKHFENIDDLFEILFLEVFR